MTFTQRHVYEAIDLALANARELLEMSFAARDKDDLYAALVERFGITNDQADVIGSFSFNLMTQQQRTRFAEALAAQPKEP